MQEEAVSLGRAELGASWKHPGERGLAQGTDVCKEGGLPVSALHWIIHFLNVVGCPMSDVRLCCGWGSLALLFLTNSIELPQLTLDLYA